MNRIFKFRAWHKEKKRMYRVVSLGTSDNGECAVLALWSGFAETDLVGDNYPRIFELMQFTGLKDKNGKEIFDGDIVKFDKKTGLPDREIKFLKNGVNLKSSTISREGVAHGIEVIGNIHENPNLMPKKHSKTA